MTAESKLTVFDAVAVEKLTGGGGLPEEGQKTIVSRVVPSARRWRSVCISLNAKLEPLFRRGPLPQPGN